MSSNVKYIIGVLVVIILIAGGVAVFTLQNNSDNDSQEERSLERNESERSNDTEERENEGTEAIEAEPETNDNVVEENADQETVSENAEDENEKCLITIQDQLYDVQSLRSIHPGGDIYNCGTDMTQMFLGQHGSDFARIEEYKVD
jgi:cytochrome b involved in lipid metabolism